MKVAITGAAGFIGRNLSLRLSEMGHTVLPLTRESSDEDWFAAVAESDAVVHLAGANRPSDPAEFMAVNLGAAELLAQAVAAADKPVRVIVASSAKAGDPNPYGQSKFAGEERLLKLAEETRASVHVLRLVNVFGKWARPNYNSAVATFCHNISRRLPIRIEDPDAPLSLLYIDDLVDSMIAILAGHFPPGMSESGPIYTTTVGEVAAMIEGFREDRGDNMIAEVGTGLIRALYATYVSALPVEEFTYTIAAHSDPRGSFSEMLKTRTSGQFSYFTAHPGVTRGGHYHHTKTEKFLIVSGRARFRFRHMLTGEFHEVETSGEKPQIVETVPGWTHDVTNIGDDVLISLLWANEIFSRERPDTYAKQV